ncbi:MAG: two-component sensor histidine kinase, partial [Pseudomonadota bacterium]|nr:two-component sensor histidine kinase [Pseudomonadota bacterium]
MVLRALRSAGVRLALGYALVFGVSAALLVTVLWVSSTTILTHQVDAAIEADEQGLAEQWDAGGPTALFNTIQNRISSNLDNDAIYLVLDSKGQVLGGNLDTWPTQVAKTDENYEINVERNGRRNVARFHRYDLPAGYSLLVGREVTARAALRSLLTEVLAWSLGLIGLLSISGAFLLKKLFSRMVSQVSATADAISSGDLTRR